MLLPYLAFDWTEWSYPGYWRESMPTLRRANENVKLCVWAGPLEIGLKS